MPAEQNHQEKCSFTWKVGVLTWESCDGFCRGKRKARIREGSITQQAPSACPHWFAVAKQSRSVAEPHRSWEQHGEPANLSQDHEKPAPAGAKQTRKASLKHTSEKNGGWGSFGFSLAGLSHPVKKPHLTQWWNPETPKFPEVVLVSASTLPLLLTWEFC